MDSRDPGFVYVDKEFEHWSELKRDRYAYLRVV